MPKWPWKPGDLPIYYYAPDRVMDWSLLSWYRYLVESGEFKGLFMESMNSPHAILNYFARNGRMIMHLDLDRRIQCAAWIEPFSTTAAYFGLWLHPNERKTKKGYQFNDIVHQRAMNAFELLLTLARNPKIIKVMKHYGYDYKCMIPKAFDGEDVHLLVLTREAFENRPIKRRQVQEAGI